MRGAPVGIAWLILTGATPQAAHAAPPTRHIVVLNQFEPSLPLTVSVSRGLLPMLEQLNAAVSTEYLGHRRSDASHGGRDLARWYAARYADQRVDLVVAVGGDALQLLLDSRDELWPGVPIVFCTIFEGVDLPPRLPVGVTGSTIRLPVREDLDLALKLLPETHRIAFVSGVSPLDRGLARLFWEAFRSYDRRLEVTDLTGMTYEETRDRLAALPEGSIALGLSMLTDGKGRQLPGPTIAEMLTERSRAPFFAVLDTVLGHGIVGGWLVDFEQVGREAGALVQRVLGGESPEAIPVTAGASVHLAFDARQLERWGIPRDRLPTGSEVMFSPPPPVYARPWAVLVLLTALGLQALLVAKLLLERRRSRRFERDARENRARIAHVNRVAVVGELAATLAHEVSTPIGAMLNDARAARRFLDGSIPRITDVRACLDAVEEQGQRAREILMQTRRALRKDAHEDARCDLSQAVRDAVHLVRSDAREVWIEAAPPDAGPQVACEPVQLQQVLLNLLLNAVDAVRAQPPERRRVEVEVLTGPDSAEVVVRDWGSGLSPEQRERLFEPFFTTKSDGLGLGLSITRSIVEAHGGRIEILPPGEVGAAFQFVLPLAGSRSATNLRVV